MRYEDKQLEKILSALQKLCNNYDHQGVLVLPPENQWPKTREIAEYCDVTIYIARHYLMKLVEKKKAYVTATLVNNSLRWYIAAPPSILFPAMSNNHHCCPHRE